MLSNQGTTTLEASILIITPLMRLKIKIYLPIKTSTLIIKLQDYNINMKSTIVGFVNVHIATIHLFNAARYFGLTTSVALIR